MAAAKEINMAEVRRHRNQNSLWLVINNEVLDVTKFMDEHPGGADLLLEWAGKDATQAFDDVGHSSDARSLLKKYKIGILPANEMRNAESCCPGQPSLPKIGSSLRSEKTWRTFDGSPSRRSLTSRSRERPPEVCSSGRIGTIIVPRESNLKWLLLLLGAVIVLGVAYKKYSQ